VAADKFYSFKVRGYRKVDDDVAPGGFIFSDWMAAQTLRYRPVDKISFNGDITGTIHGVDASQVILHLLGVTSDRVLSRAEKPQVLLLYNQLTASLNASRAKALQLGGVDTYIDAVNGANVALRAYLAGLEPKWNDFTQDTPVEPAEFQAAFATMNAAQADLDAAIIDRASKLADWDGVNGPGKPANNATVGAPPGTSVGGVPAEDIADAVKDATGNVVAARDQFLKVKAEIDQAVDAARAEAEKVRSDLTAEVERAKGAEGTLTTSIVSAKTIADRAEAAVTDEALVRARDNVALSDRLSTTEAQLKGDQDSALKARIISEETARATADDALANRVSVVESSNGAATGALNANAFFEIWPDGQETPTGWQFWGDVHTISRVTEDRVSQTWALRQTSSGNINSGVYQPLATLKGAGWYVIEADVDLNSGSWRGAGVSISGRWNLAFDTAPDNADVASATQLGNRRWSLLVHKDADADGNFHLMTNYTGFGSDDKDLTWHRCSIRVASDAEVKAGRALEVSSQAIARIVTEETTRAAQDSALGDRITKTEAQLDGSQGSQLLARIQAEETARVSDTGALASRTAVIEASSDVAMNKNARFTAPFTGSAPTGWNPWGGGNGSSVTPSTTNPGRNGTVPVYMHRVGNSNIGLKQDLENIPAGWYVIEAEVEQFEGNWQGSGIYIDFWYRENYKIGFGNTPDINDFTYSGPGYNRRTWSVLVYNSAQTNLSLHAMGGWEAFGFDGSSSDTYWHRCVVRPATDGEIKGKKALDSTGNLTARVTTTESAVSNLNGRTAAFWEVVAVAGNNRAQLMIRADANGRAGVDIVGDVLISGDLFVTGSVNTRAMANSSISNAVSTVQLGFRATASGPQFTVTRTNSEAITFGYTGGRMRVDAQFEAILSQDTQGTGGCNARLMLRQSNGEVFPISRTIPVDPYKRTPYTFWALTAPLPGTTTMWLEFEVTKTNSTSAAAFFDVSYVQLMAEEVKR
jgi:uncharacterized protein YbdZ (MbtH family)